jgi:hypothetical protein
MNIWIVEDEEIDVKRAIETIARATSEEPCEIFWDREILWSAELIKLPLAQGDIPVSKLEHMPAIVILDLLDKNDHFAAGSFYDQLRLAEVEEGLPPAFVIVWSVKTGLPEVNKFQDVKPKIDRRLAFTNTKTEVLLEAAVAHCFKSWREAQHL